MSTNQTIKARPATQGQISEITGQYSEEFKRNVATTIKRHVRDCGYVSWLFGPANVPARMEIMQAIHGARLPKSKCGITAVMDALYRVFPVLEYTCIADRERKLGAFILAASK